MLKFCFLFSFLNILRIFFGVFLFWLIIIMMEIIFEIVKQLEFSIRILADENKYAVVWIFRAAHLAVEITSKNVSCFNRSIKPSIKMALYAVCCVYWWGSHESLDYVISTKRVSFYIGCAIELAFQSNIRNTCSISPLKSHSTPTGFRYFQIAAATQPLSIHIWFSCFFYSLVLLFWAMWNVK